MVIQHLHTIQSKYFKKKHFDFYSKLFFYSMKNKIPMLDWNDTFIDVKHLRASFPDYKIRATEDDRTKHVPPFR